MPGEERTLAIPEPQPDVIAVTPDMITPLLPTQVMMDVNVLIGLLMARIDRDLSDLPVFTEIQPSSGIDPRIWRALP